MGTPVDRAFADCGPAKHVARRLTVADVAAMPRALPTGDVEYGLCDGKLTTSRLLSSSDLDGLPNELPSGPVDFELDDGLLVPTPIPTYWHGTVHVEIGVRLHCYVRERALGRSGLRTGLVLRRNPDRVVAPDIWFAASGDLPIRTDSSGYLETVPDLVVEVTVPSEYDALVASKVTDYLSAGVKVVWVVDPAERTVSVHRDGHGTEVLRRGATLTCEPLLPGFRLELAEMFKR